MEPAVEIRPGLARTAIRRRWRVIATMALIGLLGGYVATLVTTPAYTATAVVFLNPLDGNPYSPDTSTARADQLTALETEATLLRTASIGARANEEASGKLAAEPESRVSVTVPSNSQVLRVGYRAETAGEAQLGAQAFATAYLDHRHDQAESTASAQQERLESQFESTQELLDRSERQLHDAVGDNAELGASPNTARVIVLQQQAQTYANQLAQLRIEISAVASTPTDPGDVISPAVVPTQPDGLSAPLMVAAGLLTGLGLGLIVALVREHNDDRVHDPHDVAALGSGPVLSVLPHPYPLTVAGRTATAAVSTLVRDTAESFRVLRTAVLTSVETRPAVVSVSGVTDAVDGRGVAIGLAHALERTGRRVAVVVVGHAGEPAAPAGPLAGPGLSDLLKGADHTIADDRLAEALHSGAGTLVALGPGRFPLVSEDLVSSPALAVVLDRLRELVEFVVVAAPAATTAAGQELAAIADAAILAAHLERSTHDDLLAAGDALAHRQARQLGVALIEQPPRIRGYEPPDPWSVLTLRPAGPGTARHSGERPTRGLEEHLADVGSGDRA